MLDYAKLYVIMCGAVSDALDVMPRTLENFSARRTLECAIERAEEYYIRNAPDTEDEDDVQSTFRGRTQKLILLKNKQTAKGE